MVGEVKGLRELQEKLRLLGANVAASQLRGAARDAMRPVAEQAAATVPVGTEAHKTYKGRTVTPGFAQRSVKRASSFSRARGVVRAMVGVAKEAFYAVSFVERGTSKMPARPWLVPAFESTKDAVLELFKKSLTRRIERAARKQRA